MNPQLAPVLICPNNRPHYTLLSILNCVFSVAPARRVIEQAKLPYCQLMLAHVPLVIFVLCGLLRTA